MRLINSIAKEANEAAFNSMCFIAKLLILGAILYWIGFVTAARPVFKIILWKYFPEDETQSAKAQ